MRNFEKKIINDDKSLKKNKEILPDKQNDDLFEDKKDQKFFRKKTRRDFLKMSGLFVAGGAVAGIENTLKVFSKNKKEKGLEAKQRDFLLNEKLKILMEKERLKLKESAIFFDKKFEITEPILEGEAREEQAKIEEFEIKNIEDIFLEQFLENGKINLDLGVSKRIRQYWKKQYSKGGLQHKGLLDALDRMSYWYNEITEAFEKASEETGVNIPKKFIYLAIPESHAKIRARSHASAVGYYQLIANTARSDEAGSLIVNDDFDERLDVPENARGAATYLATLYNQLKGTFIEEEERWKLVLARYNGNFVKSFKRGIDREPILIRYNLYLAYREKRINAFLQDKLKNNSLSYNIKAGDTLEKISLKFGKSVSEIKENNNLTSDKIFIGEEIKIPVTRDNIETQFKNALSIIHASMENLNYPEKFFAIFEVIKEGGLLLEKEDDKVDMIRTRGRDSLSLLGYAKKHRVSIKYLQDVNPHILNINTNITADIYFNIPQVVYDMASKQNKIIATERKIRMPD